jgi:CubicO group peptidase (beta-lactamase class C family)
MTSGLDDGVPDHHCTLDTCLNYLANPGMRWAYHNAPYTLLEKVLENATGKPVNTYTQDKLKLKTGITGSWFTIGYNNVFFSRVRSMARFGLLMQNNCIWNKDTLLYDTAYVRQMTNTSQNLNLSYGYLWWLNGKTSFMVPTSQFVFSGSYAPEAPADMFAGLGKNGQIVSVSKSKGLVVVRMGNQANGDEVTFQLCNGIWQKLNEVMCQTTSVTETEWYKDKINIYPNPATNEININLPARTQFQVLISNMHGQTMLQKFNQQKIDISGLDNGWYMMTVIQGNSRISKKIFKSR